MPPHVVVPDKGSVICHLFPSFDELVIDAFSKLVDERTRNSKINAVVITTKAD